eukprot:TRINITY_DN17335_c0_g1_i1.p1 TRINITY_DN17335_c0_g1~~TRINITY_DN17335_c0_g1_i1.p1  ORF type:complete len:549 (-),score=105.31 TRINITY_DN17335_c0_g1_i1:225-1871(-)
MIELSAWRARIGLFRSPVKCRSNSKLECVSGDTNCDTVGLSDLLLAVVCCLLSVSVLRSLVVNVKAVSSFDNDSYFSPVDCGHVQGTVTHSDTVDSFLNDGMQHQLELHAAVSVCVAAHVWLALKRLLMSGDVELNPGPVEKEQVQEGNETNLSDKINQILNAIVEQNKKQEEQARKVTDDLNDIKGVVKRVDERCEEISQRCNSLEKENQRLTTTVLGLVDGLSAVSIDVSATKQETGQLSTTVHHMQEQINSMCEDIDRLESFSRRDNLRMFGIPESDREDYTKCASAVINVLNEAGGGRTWTEDDVVRAHRVGQARHGGPKPVIAKFRNWNDKMFVIRDRQFRGSLDNIGVRVANDLTRQQAAIVARAKRDGQAAYFVRGRMVIGPRRPDPRSYAEVTAGAATSSTVAATAEGGTSQPVRSPPMTAEVVTTAAGTRDMARASTSSGKVFPTKRGGSSEGGDRHPTGNREVRGQHGAAQSERSTRGSAGQQGFPESTQRRTCDTQQADEDTLLPEKPVTRVIDRGRGQRERTPFLLLPTPCHSCNK